MKCEWKFFHKEYGIWEGECGLIWNLTNGTPKDNDMNFCPKCGRVLVENVNEADDVYVGGYDDF